MAVDGIVVSVMSNATTGVAVLKVSGYLDTTTSSELVSTLSDIVQRTSYLLMPGP